MVKCISLSAVLLVLAVSGVPDALRITNDTGGNIGLYVSRFEAVKAKRQNVVIDGKCFSACTLVLAIVPQKQICVTDNAVLGFHAAWRPGFLGFKILNEPATYAMTQMYPDSIRRWIASKGGLNTEMIYLSGTELEAIYLPCK